MCHRRQTGHCDVRCALRVFWLYQCLFMLRWQRGYAIIWDSSRLWQQFEAIMHLRRGWDQSARTNFIFTKTLLS